MTSKHPIDASIVLNIHREAVFLRRTLLSLDDAVKIASFKGFRFELVAVLDRADDETRHVLQSFDLSNYERVQIVEVDNGSLGLSRNDGIENASGEFIFTSDADDLISENFIYETLGAARRLGRRALYFPEHLLGFGDQYYITSYQGLDDATPLAFIDVHPYISRVCAHRDVFKQLRYADLKLSKGYAFEDWHFNAEAVAQGLNIHVVPSTILFYRQRPGSLLRVANSLSIRQIPPTRLFDPNTFLEVSKPYYERLMALRDIESRFTPANRDFLKDEKILQMIVRANSIEPGISAERYSQCPLYTNSPVSLKVGLAYYVLCEIIQDRKFSDVYLFPFMSRGGAEKYCLSVMEALYTVDPFANALVFLAEKLDQPSWTHRLPPNVTVIDMNLLCRSLSLAERCLVALKLIEASCANARIHMRQSAFADKFLSAYGPILKDKECIYYRFNDTEIVENGALITKYSPLELISDNLDNLSKIVCDSAAMIRKDQHRIGTQNHKWHRLYAPIEFPAALPSRECGAEHRILWASRLDSQKRPSLLPLIAAGLRNAASQARIEVFGGSVFKEIDLTALDGFSNLQYQGAYDGFDTLPLSRFWIFLYTSLCDGVPNTLLEAMTHGLAVIAPDVGGISEVIIDGETGILLPSLADDDEMAASYVKAALTLLNNPDLTRTIAEKGRAFVRRTHAPEVHSKRVAEIFGVQQRSSHNG